MNVWDALRSGSTRFFKRQKQLCIAPSALTRRLESFVTDSLMELRRSVGDTHEHVPTEQGRSLKPAILATSPNGETGG